MLRQMVYCIRCYEGNSEVNLKVRDYFSIQSGSTRNQFNLRFVNSGRIAFRDTEKLNREDVYNPLFYFL